MNRPFRPSRRPRAQCRDDAARPLRAEGPRRPAGFTLIEILLALSLLTLLLSIGAWTMSRRGPATQFDEGVERLEMLLHRCRAEAALRGRRVRLSFEAMESDASATSSAADRNDGATTAGRVVVSWEAAPFESPGEYVRIGEAWAGWPAGMSLVVEQSSRFGVDAARTVAGFGTGPVDSGFASTGLQPIVFQPDGSTASTIVVLASADPADPRRCVLIVDGGSGGVTREMTDVAQLDDVLASIESGEVFTVTAEEAEAFAAARADAGQSRGGR